MALSRRCVQSRQIEASCDPQKYFSRKKPLDCVFKIVRARMARREAWPWEPKSLSPSPPLGTEQISVLRATVSTRDPHRKGQMIELTRSHTHRGGGRILETKSNLDNPRMFKTKTLPIKESERFFQEDTHLSSLEILGSQLSQSTLSVPKNTPNILIFFTHERSSGWSGLSFQAPSHKASVFALSSLAPEPRSKCEMASKSANSDLSFLQMLSYRRRTGRL